MVDQKNKCDQRENEQAGTSVPQAGRGRVFKLSSAVALGVLVGIALLLRIDYLSWQKLVIMPDTHSYLYCADNIVMKGQLLDPQRTPGYPLFLVLNYVVFGYRAFVPVIIVQSLLGIVSVLLVYLIMLKLTHNRLMSFICGLVFASNYHVIQYESYLVTESLGTFLVVLSIYVFLMALEKGFPLVGSIMVGVCYLSLIFVRPIFVAGLIVIPTIGIIYLVKQKNKRGFLNLLIAFVVIVLVPIGLWCSAEKRNYGFFSLSNISHCDGWAVVLQREVHHYAPEEYQEFTRLIEQARDRLIEQERSETWAVIRELGGAFPQQSEVDYSYLMRYSVAAIKRAPFLFLKGSVVAIPEAFSKVVRLRSREARQTLVFHVGRMLYNATVYRIFHRQPLWLVFSLCTIFLLWYLYRKDFYQWLVVLLMLMVIWLHLSAMVLFGPTAHGRLRMPVDSLILIVFFIGLYHLINVLKGWYVKGVERFGKRRVA